MENVNFKAIVKVGQRAGLKKDRLHVFIEYILRRFPDNDEDYWEEWATRFASGTELSSSDLEGQGVLGDIAKEYGRVSQRIRRLMVKS